ncbi:YceI family protein [Helicobacter anatolicus]|uniref:YceI family protein n=1 Tax=Helicobacter anatolicus TaxID=2905874 RepID=UPI001E47906A|nr:YceI family protein [Helicobacter anatolicus]MCE3040190.1 YceI family protein [Helicobacter anatolicus]
MKKLFYLFMVGAALSFAKPYNIDKSHSSVDFEIKHLSLTKVKGSFANFEGKIDIDPKTKIINSFAGNLDIASIDTKDQKRDNHLKASDFFDVAKFPKAEFKMTKFENGKIYGSLTFRGITKQVVWDAQINGPAINPMNKQEFIALEIEGKVNRKDFEIGLGFANVVLSDEVKFSIQLEVYAQ